MALKEETGDRFNVETLRHAVEDRDPDAMLSLFTEDAEYEVINRNAPPGAPQTLHGREAIGAAVRDVLSRDMTHELRSVVVEEDHAAYEELCTYPDGTKVVGIAMLDLADGRIIRCRSVEEWDGEEAAKAGPRGVQHTDFSDPEETRTFDHGRLDLVDFEGGSVGRFQLDPGWRWSTDVKPLAGTDLCQNEHFAYHVSGTLHVRMADGTEFTVGPGHVTHVPPGHDAWVEGDEAVTLIDWAGATHYAQR